MTQVRDRLPPGPGPPLSLLSAHGVEEEGVTKARALGVIRKGLMSCFGPGSHPGCPLREAIQGPGADHRRRRESLRDGVSFLFFAHRYESDPALSAPRLGGVCLHVAALGQ